MMETSSASMYLDTMSLPRLSGRNAFRVDLEGRLINSVSTNSRLAGSARRTSSPPADDIASRVEQILNTQESNEDQAAVAVFELIRSSLNGTQVGPAGTVSIVRAVTGKIDRFTRPRLLVNLLMATYPLRTTLGEERRHLVDAIKMRLRTLIGDERTTQIVDRLR